MNTMKEDGIDYVVWEDGDLLPDTTPPGCEYKSDGGSWKKQTANPATWGKCRRRWPKETAKDPDEFPGCPPGCMC
jgi:hypothetical protein